MMKARLSSGMPGPHSWLRVIPLPEPFVSLLNGQLAQQGFVGIQRRQREGRWRVNWSAVCGWLWSRSRCVGCSWFCRLRTALGYFREVV